MKTAFSLAEMLVAAAVSAVAAAALASALSSAVMLERRVSRESPAVMQPALRALERDLSACMEYGEEPFLGSALTMTFMAAHRYFDVTDARMREEPAAVTYRLREGTFVCEVKKTAVTAETHKGLRLTALIGHVDELSFSYGVFDKETKTLKWQRSYRGKEPPDAVAVRWRRGLEKSTGYLTVYRDAQR